MHFRAWELSIRLTVFKVSEVWRVLMSPKAIAIVVKATLMLWCGSWMYLLILKCAKKVTLLWPVYSLARSKASYQWPLIKALLMASVESWFTIVWRPSGLGEGDR